MIYVIESIRNRDDGSPHEREERRKGHRVFIGKLYVGHPMCLVYIDENNAVLRTSTITEKYEVEGFLVVITRNTTYTFREETEVADNPEN